MSNENSRSNRLQKLGESDYKIVEGQPNIKGWTVKDTAGRTLGEVGELLFYPESRQVRYIVLDMNWNDLDLEERDVLIPIGLAELHESDDEVVLPNVSSEQLKSLPEYDGNDLSIETESEIERIFGKFGDAVAGESLYNQDKLYNRRQLNQTKSPQTVVGIFDNGFEAQTAVGELKSAGFAEDEIDLSLRDGSENRNDDGNGISAFFSNLIGNHDEASRYTELAKRGSVITVHTSSYEEARRAAEILDQHGAVDVDEHFSKAQHDSLVSTSDRTEENISSNNSDLENKALKLRSKIIEKPVDESSRLRFNRRADDSF